MTSPTEIPTVGDLQVDQDVRFQRRMWATQRVGWAGFAVVAVLALTGLLGDGPLSEGSAKAGDVLEVRYGRIERHRSPSVLALSVATAVAAEGKVQVWLDRTFVDKLRVEGVTPEPESVETGTTKITYTFEIDESERAARISFDVVHQGIGSRRGAVGIAEGPAVSFRQLVLP